MRVCDRCLDKTTTRTRLTVKKITADKRNKSGLVHSNAYSKDLDLCPGCLADLLTATGAFVERFLKDGDEEEGSGQVIPSTT